MIACPVLKHRAAPRRARPAAKLRLVAMAAPFPKRLLGNTGLEVSVLGFGASPLGSVFEVGWFAARSKWLKWAAAMPTTCQRPRRS